ncbi:MAG: hypothetical protein AABO58_03075 [Acidobacteriota bacterium]
MTLAPLLLYAALAVVMTWPLALRLTTAVADLGDPLLNVWILDWDCHALTHAPWRIFDAPLFYPSKVPLAYSENLIAVALAVLPFHLGGVPPIGVYNIAVLLGLTLSAYAGYILARMVTGSAAASFVAGLLYGFVPYKLAHLQHLQILWSLWPPLLLAALFAYRRTPSRRNAALIAAAIVLSAMTNLYYFFFGVAALGLALVTMAIAERHDRRFWLRLIAALAVAGALLVPILRPYAIVSKDYDMRRGYGESLMNSATPADWLIAAHRSLLYGKMADPERRQNERELFPGLLILLLAAAAVLLTAPQVPSPPSPLPEGEGRRVRWLDATIVVFAIATYVGAVADNDFLTTKFPASVLVAAIIVRFRGNLRRALERSRFPLETWIAAVWIAVGVLGSLGLHAFFHAFLFQYVPGFRATRVPARWAMIAYAGLVPWAAWGAASLMRGRRWVVALLVALALLDVWPRIRWEMAPVEVAPVDRWIAEAKAGPLFFLPIERLHLLYEYMLRSTIHHQPTMNAISGFEPPLHRTLRSQPLSDTTLDLLERNGYRFVVVRPDWAGAGIVAIYPWLRRNLVNGRLAFVRRFDYAMNGDWVFALTRVEKQWARFRTPDVRDEELQRLLAYQPVYAGATFGQLHQPSQGAEIKGPLEVSGWALSPHGIRGVTVLVDAGRQRFPAQLFPRADVTASFPWYPRTPRPAFAVVIPARPRGVGEETDVQIEILDGRGDVTRLRDVLITWQ